MARAVKKTKELTLEEKLDQALVPVTKFPYEIPSNWCFFYFTSLINIEGGTQPPKSQFVDTPQEGYIRLIQIRDFATDKYTVYVPDTPKMRHIEEEDILIARYGASLGRICTGRKGVYNVALAKTIFSETNLDIVSYNEIKNINENDRIFAIEYLPGQYDQRGDWAAQCIQIVNDGKRPNISTAKVYILSGNISDEDFEISPDTSPHHRHLQRCHVRPEPLYRPHHRGQQRRRCK